MSTDDPFGDLREPVLAAAATLTPPTAAEAGRRLRRRRAQRAAVASVAVLVVVAGGVGLAGRAPEREITAAGLPIEGSTGTTPRGTSPGTVPGTVPDRPVPDEPLAATTTTTTPSGEPATPETFPDPTPPTTTAHSEVFAGTYRGIGHFSPTGSCGDISQDLDLTLTLVDGRTWTYHSDYCSTTDADGVWHGAGPFRITTDDGATLVGIFGSVAQLPTDGVPYEIRVTGGTGRFEGATGSCALTIHLRDVTFGVQENTGTFDCSIGADPASP